MNRTGFKLVLIGLLLLLVTVSLVFLRWLAAKPLAHGFGYSDTVSFFDEVRSFFTGGDREPFPELPSIYAHISAHLREDGPGLLEGGDTLPDDALVRSDAGFGWAPGAMDGAFVRHWDGAAETPDRVDAL